MRLYDIEDDFGHSLTIDLDKLSLVSEVKSVYTDMIGTMGFEIVIDGHYCIAGTWKPNGGTSGSDSAQRAWALLHDAWGTR